MATIREEFFTALSKGAKWDVGVSINRTNPLPLDVYSVFDTEDALNAYVSGKFSYPGQVLALIKADETIIYYLDQNKALQEVGGKIEVDGKSVQINDEGKLEVVGFSAEDAKALTLPQKQEDGSIKWVGIDAIVKGDGNTTYKFTLTDAKTGFVVTPVNNGVDDTAGAVTVGFDVYTKSEVNALVEAVKTEIGVASKAESSEGADDAVAATGIYKLIEDEIARAVAAENNLNDKIGKEATDTEESTGVYAYVDNVVETLVNGIDAEKVDSLNELIDWVETHGDVADIKADIEANADAIEVLNGDNTVVGSVDNKIAALNIGDYAKTADVESTYATKDYVGTIPTDEKYSDISNVISYVNKKAEETLAAAQGGSSETAASVKQQLDNYKSENNTKVNKNIEDISTINDKLKDIESGAQVNVIESVVAKDGAKLTATTEGKVVTIDDTALVTLINAAQTKANEAAGAAATAQSTADTAKSNAESNATEIDTLKNTTIPGVKAIADKNAEDISSLTTRIGAEEGKVSTLESIVSGKADSSTVEALAGTVGTNTGNITGLTTRVSANETAIATINETLGDKANSTDVYTKSEINAITGTVAEGKTIVDMINDAQTAATYNDTQVKADIKANADAIAILNADDKTEGSVDYKVAQEVAKIINDNDDSDIDTLNEIAAWITSDTTGAAKMNADIIANTAAISKLNGSADTEGSVLAMIAANAPTIATVDVVGLVKSVADTVENGVSVASDGTMSVNSLNVNKLVQDDNTTLILNGGSANN